jgi:hypothetical protein
MAGSYKCSGETVLMCVGAYNVSISETTSSSGKQLDEKSI